MLDFRGSGPAGSLWRRLAVIQWAFSGRRPLQPPANFAKKPVGTRHGQLKDWAACPSSLATACATASKLDGLPGKASHLQRLFHSYRYSVVPSIATQPTQPRPAGKASRIKRQASNFRHQPSGSIIRIHPGSSSHQSDTMPCLANQSRFVHSQHSKHSFYTSTPIFASPLQTCTSSRWSHRNSQAGSASLSRHDKLRSRRPVYYPRQ